jgi:hypothetical protein
LTEQVFTEGKWHIPGSLAYEPKSVIRSVLTNVASKLFAGIEPTLLVISPLPRYVTEPCCANKDHIQIINLPDYIAEIEQNVESIDDLLAGWAQNINSRSEILNFRAVADNLEAPLPGQTIQGDPVHATGPYYAEMAALVAESVRSIVMDDGGIPPPAKRIKLASIVVQRENERPQAGNPSHKASWSTGKLPPARGRGSGNNRGFRPFLRGRASMAGLRLGPSGPREGGGEVVESPLQL